MIESKPHTTATSHLSSLDDSTSPQEHAESCERERIATTSMIDPRLAECESLMIGLEGGRFVVVYFDDTDLLQSMDDPVEDLRCLEVDQRVLYRNHPDRVLAIQPYR